MPEALDRPRPNLLTGDNRCLLIGSKFCDPDPRQSKVNFEHLIPRLAGKEHPSLFKAFPGTVDPKDVKVQISKWTYEIIEKDENIIILHRSCHSEIDNGPASKSVIYQFFGVAGLILFIGTYPRAVDRNLQDVQYHQWCQLFNQVEHNLQVQDMRDAEPLLRAEYAHAERLVGMFLFTWSRGDFFEIGSLKRNKKIRAEVSQIQALGIERNPSKHPELELISRMS